MKGLVFSFSSMLPAGNHLCTSMIGLTELVVDVISLVLSGGWLSLYEVTSSGIVSTVLVASSTVSNSSTCCALSAIGT